MHAVVCHKTRQIHSRIDMQTHAGSYANLWPVDIRVSVCLGPPWTVPLPSLMLIAQAVFFSVVGHSWSFYPHICYWWRFFVILFRNDVTLNVAWHLMSRCSWMKMIAAALIMMMTCHSYLLWLTSPHLPLFIRHPPLWHPLQTAVLCSCYRVLVAESLLLQMMSVTLNCTASVARRTTKQSNVVSSFVMWLCSLIDWLTNNYKLLGRVAPSILNLSSP